MKKLAFISLAAIMASFAASADTIVTSKTYVDAQDNLRVPINQGVGTNNANVGKTLVVNGQGNLELGTVSGLLPSGSNNQILQHNGTTWVAETMDSTPTASSTNPVTSGGVATALGGKQDTLTFDSTPTASSTNPVTSGGVKTYVDGKVSSAATVSSSSTTTAPNEKAVYDLVSPIQTAVTALQNCTHTCADQGCTLITVSCVDAYQAPSNNPS